MRHTTYQYAWKDSFIFCVCVSLMWLISQIGATGRRLTTWLVHLCDTPLYLYMWDASFIRAIMIHLFIHMITARRLTVWLLHMCDTRLSSYVWHDACICVITSSFICVTRLIYMFDDLFVRKFDMTRSYVWQPLHSYVWEDSFICATGLIHICDMNHSYVCHHSFDRLSTLAPLKPN